MLNKAHYILYIKLLNQFEILLNKNTRKNVGTLVEHIEQNN